MPADRYNRILQEFCTASMKLYTTRHLVLTGICVFFVTLAGATLLFLFRPPAGVSLAHADFRGTEGVALSVYDRAASSVVRVVARSGSADSGGDLRLPGLQSVPGASGVLLHEHGYIVTSLHVVEELGELNVSDTNGNTFSAELVATRADSDLALLRSVLPQQHSLRPVEIADSDALRIGQSAFVIGNPFGLGRSLTSGVVSALNRVIHADEHTTFRNMIQTDAAVNPGASGGGLFDSSGRLIGLVSVLYSTQGGSMGIAFAVPSNEVRDLLASVQSAGAAQ